MYRKDLLYDHSFVIYINDLSVNILSTVKQFTDDISLFSIVCDAETLTYDLNKKFQNISEWHISQKIHLTESRTSRVKNFFQVKY